jgi:hypothetical protein
MIHEFLEFYSVVCVVQIVSNLQSLMDIVRLDYSREFFDKVLYTSAIFQLRLLVLIKKCIHIEWLFLCLLFIDRLSLAF